MRRIYRNLLSIIGILLLVTIGVTFAYYTASTIFGGDGESVTVQTATLNNTTLSVDGVLNFNDTDILPGHEALSSIKVTATGTKNLVYNIIWTGTNGLETPLNYKVYKTSELIDASITCEKHEEVETGITKYYETCEYTNFDLLGSVVASGTIASTEEETKYTLVINEEIEATETGNVVYYYFVLEYPNLNESQNDDMGSTFSGVLSAEILGEKTQPIINVSVESSTSASNEWYSDVTLTATAVGSIYDIASLDYCVTTSDECTPVASASLETSKSVSVTLESNSKAQKVCFLATDTSGTSSIVTCSESYLVDSSTTTTLITLNNTSVEGNNNWYKSVTLDIEGNNEYSGITSISYCITSNDTCEPTTVVNSTNTSVELETSATGKKVCATSTDNKGATSEVACSNTYNVDGNKPSITLGIASSTEGENGYYKGVSISGVAEDNESGITKIKYCVTTSDTCTPNTEVNATSTTIELTTNTSKQRVCMASLDIAGNESETKCSESYLVDGDSPTNNSIIINSNATYATSTSVTLTLSSSGATQMCISNTTSCTSYETYSTSKSWTLTTGDGTKTVYAYFKDAAGNISSVVNDKIILDTTAPTVIIASTSSTENSITITINGSGASTYYYKIGSGSYVSSTSTSYTFSSLSAGTSYTVYVYGKDTAGNTSSVVSSTITTENPYAARNTILANKTISERTDFSTAYKTETTNILFTAQDNDGTSYYYAGAATDNYVSFAGFYWRIIRINGDGSIRLIYDGTTARSNGTSSSTTQIGPSVFNSTNINNMYVGYMYTSGEVHGLGTTSTIKEILDDWFSSNLSDYTSYIDYNAGFCGDRTAYTDTSGTTSGGGTGTTVTYYGAYIRLYTSKAPDLKCAESSDLYTTSSSSKGNKALIYPVGLITADEVAYAGAGYNIANKNYYLYTGQNNWTMSPERFVSSNARVHFVNYNGGLGTNVATVSTTYLRPVINLEASVEFSGSGTSTDPLIPISY